MKTPICFVGIFVAAITFVLSAAVLTTQDDYDFKPYDGPYPDVLPAGYCLVTNGNSFGFKKPGQNWIGADDSESAERVTHWSWFLLERDRYRRYLPPSPPPASFRPVNPELCSPEFKGARIIDSRTASTVAITESMWLWLNVPANEISVRLPSDVSKGVSIGEVLIKSKPEPVVTKTTEGWEIRFRENSK